MNKAKKLCSVLLIIMLMVTFVLPSAGYAAGADLSILENCSVTLLKDGNFKLTDTSVDVNVELDKSLEKCHLSLFAYAGNTTFDPDSEHNIRLWAGSVTPGEQTLTFNSRASELKVGYKIIASLNVPVGEDFYRPSNSQAIEIVDESGEGFKDYDYPEIHIDETELVEGAESLHLTLTGDERLFKHSVDTKDLSADKAFQINWSIGMYPDGETFDFEGDNQIALSIYNIAYEPFEHKEVQLLEPLKAGYRVRAVTYWSNDTTIFCPRGNDYEFGQKDDSVLVKAAPQAPSAAINAPLYSDDKTIGITLSGDIPEGSMLLVKKYDADTKTFANDKGTPLGVQSSVTAGTIDFTPTAALAENDKIVVFMLNKGVVIAQSEPVSVSYRAAFTSSLNGDVVTSADTSVSFTVTAQKADAPTNINIVQLCRVNADGTVDTDNPLAKDFGKSAGTITFDLNGVTLAKGDKICLVLKYMDDNALRTVIGEPYTVIKPVGADSITIVEDSFTPDSVKATVIVSGYEELAQDKTKEITSTLFLKQGKPSTDGDADSRSSVAQLTFNGPGTYEFTFAKDALKAGNTLQANIYVYNGSADTTTYRYSDSVAITSNTAPEPPASEDSVTIKETSFTTESAKATVVVNGCANMVNSGSKIYVTTGSAATNDSDKDSRTLLGQAKFTGAGTYEITFNDSITLTDGNTIQAYVWYYDGDKDRENWKYSNAVTIGNGSVTPEPDTLTAEIVGPVKESAKIVTVKLNGTIPKNSSIILYSYDKDPFNAYFAHQVGYSKGELTAENAIELNGSSYFAAGKKLIASVSGTYSNSVEIQSDSVTPPASETAVTIPDKIASNSSNFKINVSGEIPAGAVLLVKCYNADETAFDKAKGDWLGSVYSVTAANSVTVNPGVLKSGRKVVAFLLNNGTVVAQSTPVVVSAGAPIELATPTAVLNPTTGITAGQTRATANITFDKRAEKIVAKLYQFNGETLDEETAELLSTNDYIWKPGEITMGCRNKLKAGSKLQLVIDTDGVKGYSNIIDVLPSPDWGTPSVEFNVTAVKESDKTVKITTDYSAEYLTMGDEFYCDVSVYQYSGNYTDEDFEDNELNEKPWLAPVVAKANSRQGAETRGELTLTFFDSAKLKAGDRLIVKLRLPHTEWKDQEVDYLSASVPIIGDDETIPAEKVVLFNLSADTSKGARLRAALDEIGLPYEEIELKDLNQLVGYIADRDGFEKVDEAYSGKEYDTEFMLMCNVSMATLDKILASCQKYGVSVDHKAMVTDINQYWAFHELLDEIADEHEVITNLVKLQQLVKEAEKLTEKQYGNSPEWNDFTKALQEAKDLINRADPEPNAAELDQAHDKLAPLYTALTGKTEIAGEAVITIEKQANGKYTVTAAVANGTDGTEYIYTWNNKQSGAVLTDVEASTLVGLKVTVTAADKINSLTANLEVPVLEAPTAKATKNQISLNWEAAAAAINRPAAESYIIKLYKDGELVKTETTADTSIILSGLNDDTEYTVKLGAVSPVGTGDLQILSVKTAKASSGGGVASPVYSVNFNANGGSDVISQNVKKGDIVTKPSAPKKEGYTFKGWYSDSALKNAYNFNTAVNSDMTLYAKWEKVAEPKDSLILTVNSKVANVFGSNVITDVAPLIVENRVMLPARLVAESLGANVQWQAQTKQVVITKDTTTIILTIGVDTALINGKAVKLDSPAFIADGRTYTPIRFIAENLGANVEWNSADQTVTISK